VRQASADRLTLSEAIDAVGRMIDAYPNGRAAITDSYIGNMAALLCQYPRVVALLCANPIKGVATKTTFIPTVAEVVKFCEPLTADLLRSVARENRIKEQLDERDRVEAERAQCPKQTLDELKTEMAGRGIHWHNTPKPHGETAATVQAKLGLTPEQWADLPDAPPRGTFDRLVASHRGR
jgi:hypothetical protein